MSTNGKPPKQTTKVRQPSNLDPWEAEPTWSTPAKEAFECYRDMGPERSVRNVAEVLNKSATIIGQWSSRYGWVERAAAWDAECDRRRREEFFEGDAEVSREQATTAALARFGIHAFIDDFVEEVRLAEKEGRRPFGDLTASQRIVLLPRAVKALREAQQVERLARGMSTANVGGHDGQALIPADIAGKSDAELEAYLTGHSDATKASEEAKQ